MLVGLGHFADVAQTVEQVPCKHQVAGSIPVVGFWSGTNGVGYPFNIRPTPLI